jgi:hypothetical protein
VISPQGFHELREGFTPSVWGDDLSAGMDEVSLRGIHAVESLSSPVVKSKRKRARFYQGNISSYSRIKYKHA